MEHLRVMCVSQDGIKAEVLKELPDVCMNKLARAMSNAQKTSLGFKMIGGETQTNLWLKFNEHLLRVLLARNAPEVPEYMCDVLQRHDTERFPRHNKNTRVFATPCTSLLFVSRKSVHYP